ncbi:5-formyltetrahydrofolate cyclo-ligase [Psychrobacillus sp. L4]|uniref:5-formyltetrahydrofolate cyclo-ligase n=1 Tax=Psychrobacillus sp. L4 TaxID=3236892 RepID=UPI0036F1B1E7
MAKKEAREEMKNQLATLDSVLYHTYSKQIENRFLIEEDVDQASTIGLTISAFPEVDTEGIIKKLWEMGKTVVVPKCKPKERTMTFYKLENFNQLETVYMQLLEPNPLISTAVSSKDIDLLVVPGIVYDPTGYRIGYGGGYYDRFLSEYNGQTISLAFDFQVCEVMERDNFDLPVNKIITNSQIIPCQLNRQEV